MLLPKFLVFFLFIFFFLNGRAQTWKVLTDSAIKAYASNNDKLGKQLATSALAIIDKTNINDTAFANRCSKLGGLVLLQWSDDKTCNRLKERSHHIYRELFGRLSLTYFTQALDFTSFYINWNMIPEAKKYAEEAKNIIIHLEGTNSKNYAESCMNLGIIFTELQDYVKAEQNYLETFRIYISGSGSTQDLDNIYFEMALLYIYMGQLQKSEQYAEEAYRLNNLEANHYTLAFANRLMGVGALYTTYANYQRQLELSLEAKSIYDSINERQNRGYINALSNIGDAYLELKQLDSAAKYMSYTYNIFKKNSRPMSLTLAAYSESIFTLYFAQHNYADAEKVLLEALEIYKQHYGVLNPNYGNVCLKLAGLYMESGNEEKAERYLLTSAKIRDIQLSSLFSYQSENEKHEFLENGAELDDRLFSYYYGKNPNYLLRLSMQNKSLLLTSSSNLLKAVANSENPKVKKIYSDYKTVKKEVAEWYSTPLEERSKDVNTLTDKANELEKQLVRISAEFQQQNKLISPNLSALQLKLHADEAAIEFTDFEFYPADTSHTWRQYFATIVKRTGDPVFVPLFREKQLTEILGYSSKRINDLYTRGVDEEVTTQDSSLYSLVWKPLEKYLHGIKRVSISPSGLLNRVSFAALSISPDTVLSDRYLIDEYNTLISLGKPDHSFSKSDRLVLFGGIKYDADSSLLPPIPTSVAGRNVAEFENRGESWQYLPGTKLEVDNIKKLAGSGWNIIVMSEANATEESFKSAEKKPSPALIHVASHGFFFSGRKQSDSSRAKIFNDVSDPLFRCGLLFAGAANSWKGKKMNGREDGILTAYEVANMYLPQTKLVVLSACETALGDISGSEGVYGLQRAFRMAGVNNLVMSLWKVPDAESAEFMTEFYRGLFKGETIGYAFHQVQSVMRKKYPREPFKWGGWILLN